MFKNWVKWACEHAQITKIGLSDGYGGETIPMTVRTGCDRQVFDDYLGNIGKTAKPVPDGTPPPAAGAGESNGHRMAPMMGSRPIFVP